MYGIILIILLQKPKRQYLQLYKNVQFIHLYDDLASRKAFN